MLRKITLLIFITFLFSNSQIEEYIYDVEIKGDTKWKGGDDTLHLNDDDDLGYGEHSGAIHFKIRDGWKVRIKLVSENVDYFKDEGIVAPTSKDTSWYNVWGDSEIEFDMIGGDYLSIDVDHGTADGGHKGINSFSLSLDGDKQTAGAMDDECDVILKGVWSVEEEEVFDSEVIAFAAPFGKLIKFTKGAFKKMWKGIGGGRIGKLFGKGSKEVTGEVLEEGGESVSKKAFKNITAGKFARWGTATVFVGGVGYTILSLNEGFSQKYLADCKDECSHQSGDDYGACIDDCNDRNSKNLLMFGGAALGVIGLLGVTYITLKSKGGDKVVVEVATPETDGE